MNNEYDTSIACGSVLSVAGDLRQAFDHVLHPSLEPQRECVVDASRWSLCVHTLYDFKGAQAGQRGANLSTRQRC